MAKLKWLSEPTHSELGFKIKHLMITNVSGTFGEYQVEVESEGEDFTTAQINAVVKTASVSTNNAMRDEHLRNKDFFEVEKYPEILFSSDRIELVETDQFIVHGQLTMKGITRPVKLDVEFGGTTTDPWGNSRAGFVITGKIKRTEFGLHFNSVLDSGGLALGEDVKIHSEMQLVMQKEEVPA